MSARFAFTLLFSLGLLTLVACGSDPAQPDAGTLDARVLPASELFQACEEDSQCPGEGAICRRDDEGYPRGYCTVPCDDRTPCDVFGAYHHCVQLEGRDRRYCEARCLNGLDCRTGYTCAGELPPSGGICLGVCSDDAQCSAGYECEPYSGICYPAGTAPTTGGLTGAPCDGDDACRSGVCAEALAATGAPTGYVDGMCSGNCIMPRGWNSSTLYNGTVLPPGTCAGDAVCFPSGSLTEGDLGRCLPSCNGDSDCRAGYQCANAFNLSSGEPAVFDNGVCMPIDCSMTACPTGYQCVQVGREDGSVANVCGPR